LSISGGVVNNMNTTSQLIATQTAANYYFGGKLISNKNGYAVSDRLGSIGKFYPWGQEKTATYNGTEKFTGYFRDAETGLDYAGQRYHSPGQGRFLTPDPYMAKAGGANDPANPGSWNKYAYVVGDPVNHIDRSGLFLSAQQCIDDPDSCQVEDRGSMAGSGISGSGGVCPAGYFNAETNYCGSPGSNASPPPPPPCNTDGPKTQTTLYNLGQDILSITVQMDAAITPADLLALSATITTDIRNETDNLLAFFHGGHFSLDITLTSILSDFGGGDAQNNLAYQDFRQLFDPHGDGRRYPNAVPTTGPAHTYYLHDHSTGGDTGLSFHFDRFNPYTDLGGLFGHGGVDVLWGHMGVHCLDPAWRN
jgi:RHS repeat-associated protein